MPQRTQRDGKGLVHTLFLAAALSLLSAVVRRERRQLLLTTRDRRKKVRVAPRKLAASLAFATLFFAGAAFSAGAGNGVVQLLDQSPSESASSTDTTTTSADGTAGAPASADPSAAADASAAAAQPAQSDQPAAEPDTPGAPKAVAAQPSASAEGSLSSAHTQSAAAQAVAKAHERSGGSTWRRNAPSQTAQKAHRIVVNSFLKQPPVIQQQPRVLRAPVDREPEADEPNVSATVWLYRQLPDPTPPSRRLTPGFANELLRVSKRNHVDWALTLGVLRSSGERGSAPASKTKLMTLTKELAVHRAARDPWASVLSLEGETTFADRTVALSNLYRAVGIQALVKGFDWAKPSLSKQILNDKRISIYPGGRSDIERGRVNVRVLALIAYLAEAEGQVTVSCLISGHRLYARPGVISAHIYGLAADISSVGGISVLGHQQPGGITEKTIRAILLLPAEMQPRQVISLMGLGGPSFPLANHYDHIHVGY